MKTTVLLSILLLSASFAKAESFAGTSVGTALLSICADNKHDCRVIVDAGVEAQAFLVDSQSEIGPRLQKAMYLVRSANPQSQVTNQELAQAIWAEANKYSQQAQ